MISDSEREFFSLHFGIILNEKGWNLDDINQKLYYPLKSLKNVFFMVGFQSSTKYFKSVMDIKKESFSASDSELFALQDDIKTSMKKHSPLHENRCVLVFWHDLMIFSLVFRKN
jgi:hypothetical protein